MSFSLLLVSAHGCSLDMYTFVRSAVLVLPNISGCLGNTLFSFSRQEKQKLKTFSSVPFFKFWLQSFHFQPTNSKNIIEIELALGLWILRYFIFPSSGKDKIE